VVVVRHERDRIPPDPERLVVLAPDPLPLEEEPLPLQPFGDLPGEPSDPAARLPQVLQHHDEVAARGEAAAGGSQDREERLQERLVVVEVPEVARVGRVHRREPLAGAPTVDRVDAPPALGEHVPVGRAREDELEPVPLRRGRLPAGEHLPGLPEHHLDGRGRARGDQALPGETREPGVELDADRGPAGAPRGEERGARARERVEDRLAAAGEEPDELLAELLRELRRMPALLPAARGRRVDEPRPGEPDPLPARQVVQPWARHRWGSSPRVKSVGRDGSDGRAPRGTPRGGSVPGRARGAPPGRARGPPPGAGGGPRARCPPPSSAGPDVR
jgi:hypothetical protein